MLTIIKYYLFVYRNTLLVKGLVKTFKNPFVLFFGNGFSKLVKKQRKEIKPNLVSVFCDGCRALNQEDIPFWLDFGTLLGMYREKDFIEYDYDIDLGVISSDFTKINSAMVNAGFQRIRYFEKNGAPFLMAFSKLGVVIDIAFYELVDEKKLVCYGTQPLEDCFYFPSRISIAGLVSFVFPYHGFSETIFYNQKVMVPSNTAEYLESYYGEGFMTPDPDYYKHAHLTNGFSLPEEKGYAIISEIRDNKRHVYSC